MRYVILIQYINVNTCCNNDLTMIDGVLLDMLNSEKGCVFFSSKYYWEWSMQNLIKIIKRIISISGLRWHFFKTNVKLARNMSCDIMY